MTRQVWRKTSTGGWVRGGWTVRSVPALGRFWLYRDGSRFTPSGYYENAVSFLSAREARAYADAEDHRARS